MSGLRRVLDRIGTVGVGVVMFLLGGLVWWNMCGQGPYRDRCRWNGGCDSFLCMRHGVRGADQVETSGRCTKKCKQDSDCGDGYRCATLGADARDDLPPFGKPERACLPVLDAAPP